MHPITWIHIAGGLVALASGAIAVAVRKGGTVHARAGTGFVVAMFVLGVTASILSPLKSPPESPVGGIMVCYFVATAWMAARRRNGVPGRFEQVACVVGIVIAALILLGGTLLALAPVAKTTPPGPGVLFALGTICALAALGDVRWLRQGRIDPVRRLRRHLWRMCFALFIATGSFFLGQQDVLPRAVRGSALLFVLALAPLALMVFWLVRVRASRRQSLNFFPTEQSP